MSFSNPESLCRPPCPTPAWALFPRQLPGKPVPPSTSSSVTVLGHHAGADCSRGSSCDTYSVLCCGGNTRACVVHVDSLLGKMRPHCVNFHPQKWETARLVTFLCITPAARLEFRAFIHQVLQSRQGCFIMTLMKLVSFHVTPLQVLEPIDDIKRGLTVVDSPKSI